jgi:hypothetical protein
MAKSSKNRAQNLDEDVRLESAFAWTEKREAVALLLAQGFTQEEAGQEAKVSDRSIRRWLLHPDFEAEVNRLSLMVGIASRAERLRLAMRVVRKKGEQTEKDLLDWLKFAQSETDGIKLDLTALAEAQASLADGGQD